MAARIGCCTQKQNRLRPFCPENKLRWVLLWDERDARAHI
jgi:hypothetical protein